jgi:hypothetical protein
MSRHGQSAVLNVQLVSAANGVPSIPRSAVVTRASYVVCAASATDGRSVTVRLASSYDSDAASDEPPPDGRSETAAPVTVAGSSRRSNVAVTAVSRSTPVAPPCGDTLTSSGPDGADESVVNVHVTAAPSGCPSAARTVEASCAV